MNSGSANVAGNPMTLTELTALDGSYHKVRATHYIRVSTFHQIYRVASLKLSTHWIGWAAFRILYSGRAEGSWYTPDCSLNGSPSRSDPWCARLMTSPEKNRYWMISEIVRSPTFRLIWTRMCANTTYSSHRISVIEHLCLLHKNHRV